MRHRCLRKIPLYAGFSPSVSARALIILAPILRSFAHTGMRPQWNTSRRSVAVGVGDHAVHVVGRGDVEVLAEGLAGERRAEVLGDRLRRAGRHESATHRRPSSPIARRSRLRCGGYESIDPPRPSRHCGADLRGSRRNRPCWRRSPRPAGRCRRPNRHRRSRSSTTTGVPAFADGEDARHAAEELIGAYIESEFGVAVTDAACSVPPSGDVGDEFACYAPQARQSGDRPARHRRRAAADRARAAGRPAADDDDVTSTDTATAAA